MTEDFSVFTPKRIVEELDRYIIGQNKAKKAVAIALRNRLRRKLLPEAVREEIAPKNILMIGPTGVGKTEIARRLAKLVAAPFLKVEATKYTEVGYVGRDVESMIRDLMAVAYRLVHEEMQSKVKEEAEKRVEEKLLDILLPGIGAGQASGMGTPGQPPGYQPGQQPTSWFFNPQSDTAAHQERAEAGKPSIKNSATREKFRTMLREGQLEDKEVEVQLSTQAAPAIELIAGQHMEDLESAFSGIASIFGGKKKRRMVSVKEARQLLLEEESDRLVDKDKAQAEARERVEQSGIVFIDEIDKIATRESARSGGIDVSREGVQRDILPIVEGCKVNTKYGVVDTSHILFIAAGAFNVSKPSDLIPELQGRFPIRVELEALSAKDFERILKEPETALVTQYTLLLGTENVKLVFQPDAIAKLANIAERANTRTENIGARRLHTIMERLLEDISFDAPEKQGQEMLITPEFVEKRFDGIFESEDLAKYIL